MSGFRTFTHTQKGLTALGLVLCLCGCSTLPTGQGNTDAKAVEQTGLPEALAHFSQGFLFENNLEYESAVSSYEQAIAIRPDDPEPYYRIARVRLLQGRTDEAVHQLRAYAKLHPESGRVWISLALIYKAANEPERTLTCFQQAIKAEPEGRAAYLESARLLIELSRIPEAIEVLRAGARNTTQPSNCRISLVDALVMQASREKKPKDQEKLLEEAINVLKKELKDRPDAAEIFYRLGDICIRLDRWDEAIQEYEPLFQEAPDNLRIHRRLASSFTRDIPVKKAIEKLLALYQDAPELTRIPYYVGELLQIDKRPEEAISYYQMACDLFPNEGAPVICLASLELVKQPEKALKRLHDQLEVLPENLPLHETYARALLALGHHAEACTEFQLTAQLVEKDPEARAEPEFYLQHAIACIQANQTNDLDHLLWNSLGQDPSLSEPYVEFILQQEDEDLISLAIGQLLELSEREPGVVVFNLFRGLLLNTLEQHEQAREAFRLTEREALALGATGKAYLTPSYYFWYGAACERSGHIDEAEQNFLNVLSMDPKYIDADNYLAYMWADRGLNLDRALEHIQKALKEAPNNPAFLDTLGWVYYHQERYKEALAELKRAVELLPNDPTLLEHLGDALAKTGQLEKARSCWQQSLERAPENKALSDKLNAEPEPEAIVPESKPIELDSPAEVEEEKMPSDVSSDE